MPSHLSQSLLVEEPGTATPAADDDIEAVKTLCNMGFSRTQAVTALEQNDYDVQRALNVLLGESGCVVEQDFLLTLLHRYALIKWKNLTWTVV